MPKTVVIDSFPESLAHYQKGYAIVAIDIVRATTTAITAVASGRRCFPVPTLGAALEVARGLDNPLLVGEQRGVIPAGFHLNNSPSELLVRTDIQRPEQNYVTKPRKVLRPSCPACETIALPPTIWLRTPITWR